MKGQRVDCPHVSGVVLQQQHGTRIPNFDGLVRAAAGEAVATGMPDNAVDCGGVIIKRMNTSARPTVPQPHSLVVAATCNQRAVGAEESGVRTR